MRVLIVCDYLGERNPSGAGRYVLETAKALRVLGHEARILAGGGPEDPETEGISRFPFPASIGKARWLMGDGWSAMRRACRKAIQGFRPTHLVLHQPLSGMAILGSSADVPACYVFHSPWGAEAEAQGAGPLRRWPRDRLERKVLSSCNRAVTLSAYMEGEMRRTHPDLPIRVKRIPGGADLQRFTFHPASGPDLVTVRRLVPRMGLEDLVEAMARCPGATLRIGGRGPLEGALKGKIASLGLGERVRLEGHVPEEDLSDFLGSGALFVLPSERLEGFGMVIAEAMACGTPVLGTRVGAIPEVLGAFDPALVTDDLAEGIPRLLGDPGRLAAMRPRCREHAERLFRWERAGADLASWMEAP